MALYLADWEAINGFLVRLYRESDSQKHPRLMLELLNELVPVDSSAINFFSPPNRLTAISFPEGFLTNEQAALVGRYGHQCPYTAYYLATRDASWKMTTDFMPIEEFHKLDIHRIALRPLGVNYRMGGFLALMDATAHFITLHRTYRGFTEHEREILNTVHPHLVTSYTNAIADKRARNLLAQIKAGVGTPLPRFRPLPQFSRRKNEVLNWMVEGKRNAEIATILCLSPRTVEKHVSEILTALNAENRASAILAVMEFCARANGA